MIGRTRGPALLLILLSPPVAAAEFTFLMGVDGTVVRDDLLVPLAFGGAGPHFGGVFSTTLGPGDLRVRADVTFRVVVEDYGSPAVSTGHGVDARWLVPVSDAVSLGPVFVWDGRVAQYFDWDDAHGYWLGDQWVGPAFGWSRAVPKGEVDVSIAAALLGAVGRPEPAPIFEKQDPTERFTYWFTAPTQNERWVGPGTFQAARLDMRLPVSERWSFGVDTRFARTTEEALTTELGANAWMGATWGSR